MIIMYFECLLLIKQEFMNQIICFINLLYQEINLMYIKL